MGVKHINETVLDYFGSTFVLSLQKHTPAQFAVYQEK